MKIAENSFEQAVSKFKKFLSEYKLPTDIYWIFTEDVLQNNNETHETEFWLKLPLSQKNITLTEKLYEIGRSKNLGMGLSAFALCRDKICCHIIVPKDKADSKFLAMSPEHLKFSIAKDMPEANVIESDLKWVLYKSLSGKFKEGNFLVYLQSKKDLQFSDI